jgi:hypothetical protein
MRSTKLLSAPNTRAATPGVPLAFFNIPELIRLFDIVLHRTVKILSNKIIAKITVLLQKSRLLNP